MRPLRTDANHKEICAALRKIGALVTDLSRVGGGVPDLLVAYRGAFYVLEIKTDKGKLNDLQAAWHAKHKDCYVFVVRSVDEAIAAVSKFD
ncbi:MAG: hypothetical protein A3E01_04620 [Gammaproteobacteria bacterium RIFCSPHIGHO2_12_FULL_63_22]|nr:MAG: hypothetical protein A3E01_04620 [Gammaproteobacteria bacterium RIFCSPHIGHO2_12_FULL_63_22]